MVVRFPNEETPMTLDEFTGKWTDLEIEIMDCINKRISNFQWETGLAVSNVYVSLKCVSNIDYKPRYRVIDVDVDVDFDRR